MSTTPPQELDARPPPYDGQEVAIPEDDNRALKGAGGAAILGGITGALLMGPLTAVALAGAGAAAAAGLIGNKDTEKIAQATGNATVDAGRAGVAKAKQMDSKYHLMDKAKAGFETVARKAHEVNEKHHITEKVTSGVLKGAERVSKMTAGSAPPPRPNAPATM
eukprot:m.161341 g.161341  ORF g.161341 m.161341 type:complete len:164 (+) comp12061_c0_seq1:93-584(+)